MTNLVGVSELAEMFGVTKGRIVQLRPKLPEPAAVLAAGPVWEADVIVAWAEETGREIVGGRYAG